MVPRPNPKGLPSPSPSLACRRRACLARMIHGATLARSESEGATEAYAR
jgi:hypothetical protein